VLLTFIVLFPCYKDNAYKTKGYNLTKKQIKMFLSDLNVSAKYEMEKTVTCKKACFKKRK
jgi:hypothetical protein